MELCTVSSCWKPMACKSGSTRMPKGGIWFGLRSKADLNLPAKTPLYAGFWGLDDSFYIRRKRLSMQYSLKLSSLFSPVPQSSAILPRLILSPDQLQGGYEGAIWASNRGVGQPIPPSHSSPRFCPCDPIISYNLHYFLSWQKVWKIHISKACCSNGRSSFWSVAVCLLEEQKYNSGFACGCWESKSRSFGCESSLSVTNMVCCLVHWFPVVIFFHSLRDNMMINTLAIDVWVLKFRTVRLEITVQLW